MELDKGATSSFLKVFLFFLFWLHLTAYRTSLARDQTHAHCSGIGSLNRWTTRDAPNFIFLYVFCFVCGYLVFPTLFVKKTLLSPLNDFGTLVKNHLMIYMRVYFWAFFSVCLVYMPIVMPIPHSSYDCNKFWNQKVRVLQLCSSFKIILVLWSPLRFHDGHIDFFFYTLAIVNKAAVNMEFRHCFEMLISFPLAIYPKAGLLGHMVVLFLIYWRTSILFSIVTESI